MKGRKLQQKDIDNIKLLLEKGLSDAEICCMLQLSDTTVKRVKYGTHKMCNQGKCEVESVNRNLETVQDMTVQLTGNKANIDNSSIVAVLDKVVTQLEILNSKI